jgi:hypothetical protein
VVLPCHYHSIFSLMCHLGMNSRPEIQRVALYEIPMDLEDFNAVRYLCVSQLLWFLYTAILRLTLLIRLGKNKALSKSALSEHHISIRIHVNLVSSVHSAGLFL